MQIPLPFESVKFSNKKNSYRKKRRQIRRGLRWALHLFLVGMAFAFLSLSFVCVYRALLSSPLLRVTRIQVSGCQRLAPQTVIEQAGIPSGVNILSLDLRDVSHRLTNHPWIAAALNSREIPDRIRIEIEERQPVALVKGHQFYLMDSKGACFTHAVPSEHPGLPIINGTNLEALGPDCRLPREFSVLIENLHRECRLKLPWRHISEISWDNRTGLSIFMVRGGIQVDLGSSEYGPKIVRLKRALRYLKERGIHAQLRGIDLSHGNRVFVRGSFQLLKQQTNRQRGVKKRGV